MTDQQPLSTENVQQAASGLGAQLRQAREAKGLSQQDVSNNLRFSVKQINALEHDAFDAFPDAMMARGFIRSYAKYLQIDAEPLLAEFRTNSGDDAQKVIVVKSSMRPIALTTESWPWLKYILATIVVLLFLLAWMFYVEFMPEQTADTSSKSEVGLAQIQQASDSVADTSQSIAVPEAALPAAERVTAADATAAMQDITATQPPSLPVDAASTQAAAVTATPAQSAPQAGIAQPSVLQPGVATETNTKTINLSFTGQSWVSVTDKNGKLVYEKLSQNGAQESVTAIPPLTVVIGNANDTKVQYAGQAIDLSPNTKNNVARITLE